MSPVPGSSLTRCSSRAAKLPGMTRVGDVEALGGGELEQRVAGLRAHADELRIRRVVQWVMREHRDEDRGRTRGVREAMSERERVERSLLRVHRDDDASRHWCQGRGAALFPPQTTVENGLIAGRM